MLSTLKRSDKRIIGLNTLSFIWSAHGVNSLLGKPGPKLVCPIISGDKTRDILKFAFMEIFRLEPGIMMKGAAIEHD